MSRSAYFASREGLGVFFNYPRCREGKELEKGAMLRKMERMLVFSERPLGRPPRCGSYLAPVAGCDLACLGTSVPGHIRNGLVEKGRKGKHVSKIEVKAWQWKVECEK